MKHFFWVLLVFLSACSGTEPTTTSTTTGDGENLVSDGSATVGLVIPAQHSLESVKLCVSHFGFKAQGIVRNIYPPHPIEVHIDAESLRNPLFLITNLSIRRQINLSTLEGMTLGLAPQCSSSASIEVKTQDHKDAYVSYEPIDLAYTEIIQRGGLEVPSPTSQTHMFFSGQFLSDIARSIHAGIEPELAKHSGTIWWHWL